MIIFSKINKLLVFLIITELSALYLRIYNFAEHHSLHKLSFGFENSKIILLSHIIMDSILTILEITY